LNFEVSYNNPFGERKSVDISKKISLSSLSNSTAYPQINTNYSMSRTNGSFPYGQRPGTFLMQRSSVNWTGIIIGTGVIVVSIGATIVFIIKRKNKKAKKEKETKRSD